MIKLNKKQVSEIDNYNREESILIDKTLVKKAYIIDGILTPVSFIILCFLLVFVGILAITFGAVHISASQIITVFQAKLGILDYTEANTIEIVWMLRFPRIITAIFVGAALAVSGAVLQTLVHNNVADPYIMGAGPGAALGAVAIMVAPVGILSALSVPLAAFLGALLALIAVLVLGRKNGTLKPTRMILSGIAIGYLLNAALNFLQLKANPARLNGVLHWLLGSLSGANWKDLLFPSVFIFLGIIIVLLHVKHLNALNFGDEVATNLGINVTRARSTLLVASSVLTGASVALAGGVVFIGLLVPHISKLLLGPSHQKVIPFSVLIGALLLLFVDLLARIVIAPNEVPISIFTALLGAPFFLWLLRKDDAQ